MNTPTPHSSVGDLQITLARAGRTCTLTGAEVAELVGSPGLVIRLAAVLYSRGFGVGREGTTGVGGATKQEATNERNGKEINLNTRSFRDGGSKGEGVLRPEVERIACYLTDRLDDAKSLAFYRLVAARVPEEIIRDALSRALDLPPAHVRRSRAAYFTSLIRPHLQRRLPDS
jgi:hypothetical protein